MHAEGFLTLFRDQQLTRAATLVGFRSEKRKMPYVRYVKSKTKTNKQTNKPTKNLYGNMEEELVSEIGNEFQIVGPR